MVWYPILELLYYHATMKLASFAVFVHSLLFFTFSFFPSVHFDSLALLSLKSIFALLKLLLFLMCSSCFPTFKLYRLTPIDNTPTSVCVCVLVIHKLTWEAGRVHVSTRHLKRATLCDITKFNYITHSLSSFTLSIISCESILFLSLFFPVEQFEHDNSVKVLAKKLNFLPFAFIVCAQLHFMQHKMRAHLCV